MNILFISSCSPYKSIGGVERYLLNLIDFYSQKANSRCILLLPDGGVEPILANDSVKIIKTESLVIKQSNANRETANQAQQFRNEVDSIISNEDIDIVVAENFHLGLPPAYTLLLHMICSKHKIPIVLRLHSFATTPIQVELINQLPWNLISCISKSVTGDCFKKGADIETLSTDYLGVNTTVFNDQASIQESRAKLGLPTDAKIVLCASRILFGKNSIISEKGIISLIEACFKLNSDPYNLHLLLAIGKPPAYLEKEFQQSLETLQGYIQLHHMTERTTIRTFSLQEMTPVYRSADVFVLPSQNETFGQVFTEAMACGIPVIGTKVGGIPEIIQDSVNGYLVPVSDASILSQRIQSMLSNESLRQTYIGNGQQTIEANFTTQKQCEQFHTTLSRLCSI